MQVLHVAPHPDDEVIGSPAALMALRDAGHPVVNLACGLGRAADHERRAGELREACRRARFELVLPEPPVALSSGDDLDAAQARIATLVSELVERRAPAVVVSPSPLDGHPGHEVVGRAVRDALAGRPPLRWWMWGVWADLPLPTLLVPFGEERLAEILHALEAHAGELARNDFRDLVRGRAMANRVLGPERVFGHGSAGEALPYAEVLTEVVLVDGAWRLGSPGRLSGDLPALEAGSDVGWWVDSVSVAQRLRGSVSRPRPRA